MQYWVDFPASRDIEFEFPIPFLPQEFKMAVQSWGELACRSFAINVFCVQHYQVPCFDIGLWRCFPVVVFLHGFSCLLVGGPRVFLHCLHPVRVHGGSWVLSLSLPLPLGLWMEPVVGEKRGQFLYACFRIIVGVFGQRSI